MDVFWDGRVAAVLAALQPYARRQDTVDDAHQLLWHQVRMDYPAYRVGAVDWERDDRTYLQLVSA